MQQDEKTQASGPFGGFFRKAVRNWRLRHQLPFNFWIHMLGIPIALGSIPLFALMPWYWGAAALFVGYFLQWIGHQAEGNDVGEWAGIKRMLGLPFVGIAPRWEKSTPGSDSE